MSDNVSDVRVLVVEDDEELRALWRRALQVAHACVETVSTLPEAIAKLEWPDIVLLDWYLNGETSDLFLDRWTASRDGPVIVISGHELPDELYTRGVWHILKKPVAVDVVLSIVRRYIEYIEMRKRLISLSSDVRKLKKMMIVGGCALLGLTNLDYLKIILEAAIGVF